MESHPAMDETQLSQPSGDAEQIDMSESNEH